MLPINRINGHWVQIKQLEVLRLDFSSLKNMDFSPKANSATPKNFIFFQILEHHADAKQMLLADASS